MKLILDNPSYLKDTIPIIGELVLEGKFKITNSGITLLCMDASNVAFIVFKLLKSSFSSYDIKEDLTVGLNISDFKSVLRKCKDKDHLIITYDDNRLILTIKGKTTRIFKLPTIDIEQDGKESELKFECTIKTESDILTDVVEVAELGKDEGGVVFNISDKIVCDSILPPKESQTIIKADKHTTISGTCRSKYAIRYLKKFVSGSKISNFVTIQMSTDYPIKISYKIPDKVELAFILAPMVENE